MRPSQTFSQIFFRFLLNKKSTRNGHFTTNEVVRTNPGFSYGSLTVIDRYVGMMFPDVTIGRTDYFSVVDQFLQSVRTPS